MIDTMVVERRELDNSFSWMSTLGGAYSALGDYIPNFVSNFSTLFCSSLVTVSKVKVSWNLG